MCNVGSCASMCLGVSDLFGETVHMWRSSLTIHGVHRAMFELQVYADHRSLNSGLDPL